MKIKLIAIGKQAHSWVEAAFHQYQKRLPPPFALQLIEISPIKVAKHYEPAQIKQLEGEKILKSIATNDFVVGLDERGTLYSTEQLAQQWEYWQSLSRPLCFIIGGACGLSVPCKQRADSLWSLSPLTFPHLMVRVMLVEQLYRTWSILHNHPYHRN